MRLVKRRSKSKFISYTLVFIVLFGFLIQSDFVSADSLGAPVLETNGPEANLKYLFAVFFGAWAAFFGYIFFLSRRFRDLTRERDVLKTLLKEKDSHLGE